LRSTNINIIDRAEVPRSPVAPRTSLIMLMAVIAGALLAVGSAFATELFDDRLKVPEDVTGDLAQTLLGIVPTMSSANSGAALAHHAGSRELLEAFRVIRTSTVSAIQVQGPKSLLITSASQREGKSSVASKLAIALAHAQHRVVLVDADMRRPTVHQLWDHGLEPGLASVLSGTAAMAQALHSTPVPGLSVLTSGGVSSEAPELLESPVFAQLLKVLEEHFDWVIIDSPPALTVSDASIIAQRATGILFVVAATSTSARAARLAIEELERIGGRVLGVVMNRADVAHQRFDFAPYVSTDYLTSLDDADARAGSARSTRSRFVEGGV
jgi:receptor protein-tyrosine kinase